MTATAADSILAHLNRVDAERTSRLAVPGLLERTAVIKHYQQLRFESTYSDLLRLPRYNRAIRFFLDELYGPQDFTLRDAQFARVVPAVVRIFPGSVVEAVRTLAELHALSESLDTAMALGLSAPHVNDDIYGRLWRSIGRAPERDRQITLLISLGATLDRLTHNLILRHSLKLMRAPAKAAGLSALQSFLEAGFDTFRDMRGAEYFLTQIDTRERKLAHALFTAA